MTHPVLHVYIYSIFIAYWLVLLRSGTATQWRTSSWVRWCWPGRWRTQPTLRGFSWGSEAGRWPTRCPVTSVWRLLLLLNWPTCDLRERELNLFLSAELCDEHGVKFSWRAAETKSRSGVTCFLQLDVPACVWAEFNPVNLLNYLQSRGVRRALMDGLNVSFCYFYPNV